MAKPHIQIPAVPVDRDSLLAAALEHAERVSILLNAIGEELSRQADRPVSERRLDRLQGLAGRRFLQDSGLHLFIAAANLGLIEVPEPDSDE